MLSIVLPKWFSLAIGISLLAVCVASAQPVKTEIVRTEQGWQLQRGGQPYFIKGAGGDMSLDLLKESGANSIRTWRVDGKLKPLLDEAQKLGLSVTVGIWMGHERHKFDYNDPAQVARQLAQVRETVLRYKDHPAVLMWGIGNETEGYADGTNTVVWKAINDAAKLVKELDPNHPTMTVMAEVGGERVKNLNLFCPDVDVTGINSYAGCATVADRYIKLGCVKPYVITEFGPPGHWEIGKTSWEAPIEPSSTEKGEWYRRAYEGSVSNRSCCLGSYAFLWGNKQESTATWYGMLLPNGTKLQAVDTMTVLWTGKMPTAPCPAIKSLRIQGDDRVQPDSDVRAVLQATDSSGRALEVHWVLQPEQKELGIGGDDEPALPVLSDNVLKSDAQGADIRAPGKPGAYRLFAYVSNGAGAAVANMPFLVQEKTVAVSRSKLLPFDVYTDQGSTNNHYVPSGFMGTASAIKVDVGCRVKPHSGTTCMRFVYQQPADWGGVVWQDPSNDWGDAPGGFDLSGAKRLIFWARGDKGGEVVNFKMGILDITKKYPDTANAVLEGINLTPEWKQYSIDLDGKDLSRVKTGFVWALAGQGAPVTFYLDDIRYE